MKAKVGTVALVIHKKGEAAHLVEALSDHEEIAMLGVRMQQGDENPLRSIYDLRSQQVQEDNEFADYIEEILSRPFVKRELRDQGVRWFRSKMKIEDYQKCERDATRVIAGYAYKVYQQNPQRKDFLLASENAKVRILVFEFVEKEEKTAA